MVNRLSLSFLAFSCVLGACASAGLAREQVRNSNIETLDAGDNGSRVQVRGWIEIDPETFRLWSSEDKRETLEDAHCIGVVIPKGTDRELLDRKDVIVTGQFIVDVTGEYVVLGGCRNRRFIFADEIRLLAKEQQ